jgi:hypothetical protein
MRQMRLALPVTAATATMETAAAAVEASAMEPEASGMESSAGDVEAPAESQTSATGNATRHTAAVEAVERPVTGADWTVPPAASKSAGVSE